MGFAVKGDYFETCTCDVSCPCIWNGPATQDHCDVFLAWHITEGEKDGVDLSGMNAVLTVHAPKQMTDGNWKVALYLDDRATAEQISFEPYLPDGELVCTACTPYGSPLPG